MTMKKKPFSKRQTRSTIICQPNTINLGFIVTADMTLHKQFAAITVCLLLRHPSDASVHVYSKCGRQNDANLDLNNAPSPVPHFIPLFFPIVLIGFFKFPLLLL